MERVTQTAIIVFSFLLLGTANANLLEDWEFTPIVGFDVNMRDQDFENDFGDGHFREHYPDTNFYIGTRFYKYLGLEAGYEHMYRQEQKQFYLEGVSVLGFQPTIPNQRFYLSDVTMDGWHLDLMGFWPICPKTKTELTATLGLAWLKMDYQTALFEDPANPANPIVDWDSDTRMLLRIGFALRQMITNNFGTRLQMMWERTSKLEATFAVPVGHGGATPPDVPTTLADNYTASPRNSFIVGLGFFFEMGR